MQCIGGRPNTGAVSTHGCAAAITSIVLTMLNTADLVVAIACCTLKSVVRTDHNEISGWEAQVLK